MTTKAQIILKKLAAKNKSVSQQFLKMKREVKKNPESGFKVPSKSEYTKARKEEIIRLHNHPVKEVFRGLGHSMREGALTFGIPGAALGAAFGPRAYVNVAGNLIKMTKPKAALAVGTLAAGVGAVAAGAGHLFGAGVATPIVHHMNEKYVQNPKKMKKVLDQEYKYLNTK